MLNRFFSTVPKVYRTGTVPLSNPIQSLKEAYSLTLSALQSLPQDYIYRQQLEKTITQQLKSLESEKEFKMDGIEVVERIGEMNDELLLIEKLKEWKAWEGIEEKAPEGQWTYFK